MDTNLENFIEDWPCNLLKTGVDVDINLLMTGKMKNLHEIIR